MFYAAESGAVRVPIGFIQIAFLLWPLQHKMQNRGRFSVGTRAWGLRDPGSSEGFAINPLPDPRLVS